MEGERRGGRRAERGGLGAPSLSVSPLKESLLMVGGGTFPPSCKLSRHKELLNEETNGADQPSHHHPLMDQHTERGRGGEADISCRK